MIRVFFSAVTGDTGDLFIEHLIEFAGVSGTSPSSKQRNVASLHRVISERYPKSRALEVSSKSDEALGVALSAFNLRLINQPGKPAVESQFQAGKVFEFGGPFKDLAQKDAADAKRDPRLKTSGKLLHFESRQGLKFELASRSDFYDYVYLQALVARPDLLARVAAYNMFTDIEFSKNKLGFVSGQPFNCQARTAAIAVSLFNLGGINAVQNYILEIESRNQPRDLPPADNYLF